VRLSPGDLVLLTTCAVGSAGALPRRNTIGLRNPDSARRAALDMTRPRRRTSKLFEQITHFSLDHSRLR